MAKVARLTLAYYAVSTAAAVALGIVLVNVMRPGRGEPLAGGTMTACRRPDLAVGDLGLQPDGELSECRPLVLEFFYV
jgi:hypothetical protein